MIGKTDRAFFRIAQNISTLSDHPQHKIGCVLVKNHKVINTGYNSLTRTDRIQALLDKDRHGVDCPGKLHSEADCLIPFIKRKIDLSGATLYIYRRHKDGSMAMCRPCPSCMTLIKMANIKKIYYTTNDGYACEKLVY